MPLDHGRPKVYTGWWKWTLISLQESQVLKASGNVQLSKRAKSDGWLGDLPARTGSLTNSPRLECPRLQINYYRLQGSMKGPVANNQRVSEFTNFFSQIGQTHYFHWKSVSMPSQLKWWPYAIESEPTLNPKPLIQPLGEKNFVMSASRCVRC